MRASHYISICISIIYLATSLPADAARHARRPHKAKGGVVAADTSNPRYADFVIDPQTGEVFHSVNADAKRYPASLTKMMTLYLLFEALEQKRVTLSTRLQVSDYATTMPQTNLSLSSGDQIPVDTAIKALVVRSANDVAVVVGEALGGDVDHFGEIMTRKAKQLGMTGTHFENPNGLPNNNQYTTAHDMARLGIALKRDFPQYYPYFSVREFSWAGVSYYTHNRVMLRYAGVDGIKTGFIGNSGFNLVTSCKRGGRPVVGVVMGGSSGRWRDDRMIQLLNQTYSTIASRGAARGTVDTDSLPPAKNAVSSPAKEAAEIITGETSDDSALSKAGDDDAEATQAPAAPTAAAQAVTKPDTANQPNDVKAVVAVKPALTPFTAPSTQATASTTISKPTPPTPPKPPTVGPIITPANAPLPTSVVPAKPTAPSAALPSGGDWSIQVGAFSSNEAAQAAAQKALHMVGKEASGAKVQVSPPPSGKEGIYRALLVNISENQATKACMSLVAAKTPCITQQVK